MKLGNLRAAPALAALAVCSLFHASSLASEPAPGQGIDSMRQKLSMCMGCHSIVGYQASFPEVYHVPKIAGQNAAYIEAALRQYASGARSHPTMDAISRILSEQDIADVAAYYSNLK